MPRKSSPGRRKSECKGPEAGKRLGQTKQRRMCYEMKRRNGQGFTYGAVVRVFVTVEWELECQGRRVHHHIYIFKRPLGCCGGNERRSGGWSREIRERAQQQTGDLKATYIKAVTVKMAE